MFLNTMLARLLTNMCSTGSENKRVPECAYTAPDEFIKGLIDGYISGDGCVQLDGSITASSISEQLTMGISFLLSYFGVFGRLSSYQTLKNNMGSKNIKRAYYIMIRNGFAQKFAKKIRLTCECKQKRMEQITLKKEYKYENGRNQEEYPHERDVYFDPIVGIEYVDATNGVVYDFTVSETRNFNLFNGLNLRDTFHFAGSGDQTVTTGVPRVEELLNATKDPRTVTCKVFMNKKHNTIADMRETIGYDIVELTFNKITKSYEIMMDKDEEEWYEAFKVMYDDEFTEYSDCISIKIDMDVLYEYKLDMETIAEIISEEYSDMRCVFSPDSIGQMDIFVDTSNIDLPENRLVFVNTDNAKNIYIEEVVQPILSKIVISGVSGIKSIYFNDTIEHFETDGSNFKKLMGVPFVDNTRTVSNDVWDIYGTLGIEAACQFLVEEFMYLCAGINKCHIQLLADKMTHTGTIASISRYSMRNEECGPMGKASFEETMDNFLRAGAYGQKESTNGVSASIICGKRAKIGSGVCELMMNVKALPKKVREIHTVSETMNISEFNTAFNTIKKKSDKKLKKKLEKRRLMKDRPVDDYVDDIEQEKPDEPEIPEIHVNPVKIKSNNTKRLTVKDFIDGKRKMMVYFGTVETDIDGYSSLSFDSKDPVKVTVRWKEGLKIGKELFQGFDREQGVYMPLSNVPIDEQERFVKIIENIVETDDDDMEQIGYLDF